MELPRQGRRVRRIQLRTFGLVVQAHLSSHVKQGLATNVRVSQARVILGVNFCMLLLLLFFAGDVNVTAIVNISVSLMLLTLLLLFTMNTHFDTRLRVYAGIRRPCFGKGRRRQQVTGKRNLGRYWKNTKNTFECPENAVSVSTFDQEVENELYFQVLIVISQVNNKLTSSLGKVLIPQKELPGTFLPGCSRDIGVTASRGKKRLPV